MIAEVAPPEFTSNLIIAVSSLLGLVAVFKIVFPTRKPPIEAEFVSQAEFKEFKREVKEDIQEMHRGITGDCKSISEQIHEMKIEMLNANERRAIALHERINDLERGFSALNERTKTL